MWLFFCFKKFIFLANILCLLRFKTNTAIFKWFVCKIINTCKMFPCGNHWLRNLQHFWRCRKLSGGASDDQACQHDWKGENGPDWKICENRSSHSAICRFHVPVFSVAIYLLSFIPEETQLKYHLFGLSDLLFVVLASFLLNFLIEHNGSSDISVKNRRIIVASYAVLIVLYVIYADFFMYHSPDNSGVLNEFAMKAHILLVAITSVFLSSFCGCWMSHALQLSKKGVISSKKQPISVLYGFFWVFCSSFLPSVSVFPNCMATIWKGKRFPICSQR